MTTNSSDNLTSEAKEELANFSSRFMALAIDLTLLCLYGIVLFVVTGKNFKNLSGAVVELDRIFEVAGSWVLLVSLATVLTGMFYFSIMHAFYGQTIGKKIMGIRLEEQSRHELNVGICFLRWVGYFASALPLFFGFFWSFLDVEGRTWHDRLAGTKVVYT